MSSRALAATAIQQDLGTEVVGKQIVCLKVVGSTNDWLKSAAADGAAEGLTVFAEEQTSGHGQAGRRWLAPPGCCILASVLLRPQLPPDRLAFVTMLAACGAAAASIEVTGLPVQLKWPNDLIVENRKVAGVLVESAIVDGTVESAIVGIGINVNQSRRDLASLPEATSLRAETGRRVDRTALGRALLRSLDAGYTLIRNGQLDTILAEWRKRLVTPGTWVSLRTSSGVAGPFFATHVTDRGALVLRHPDGSTFEVIAGEVSVVRHLAG